MKKFIMKKDKRYRYLHDLHEVDEISRYSFKPSEIINNDKEKFHSLCINCNELYCKQYGKDELADEENELISDFPNYPYNGVCPNNAISIDPDSTFPVIDDDKCVLCTLCIDRCPVFAIYFNEQYNSILINNEDDDHYFLSDRYDQKKFEMIFDLFDDYFLYFNYHDVSNQMLHEMSRRILNKKKEKNNIDNILTRNILLSLGYCPKMRSIGDTNLRIDIIFEDGEYVYVGEIKLTDSDLLDSPRSILEDISIIHARHGIELDKIVPIIFCDHFINQRSDYYELISDIEKITGVRIRTVPIIALIMLIWAEKCDIENLFIDYFHVNNEKTEVISDFKKIIEDTGNYPFYDTPFFQATK